MTKRTPYRRVLLKLSGEAFSDPAVQGAQYYGPDGFRELRGHPVLVTSNPASHDIATQQRLWQVSEELTGVTYPI